MVSTLAFLTKHHGVIHDSARTRSTWWRFRVRSSGTAGAIAFEHAQVCDDAGDSTPTFRDQIFIANRYFFTLNHNYAIRQMQCWYGRSCSAWRNGGQLLRA